MSPITTHVLDIANGRPASNLSVQLDVLRDGISKALGRGITDIDGRIVDWDEAISLEVGDYQITFATGPYFESSGCNDYFYSEVRVRFRVSGSSRHYHVPLLLSPFGYSTYRGS